MSADILIAVDGGGTRTRAAAVTRSGTLLGSVERGPANDLQVGSDAALSALAAALDDLVGAAAIRRSDVRLVSAGLAGVDADGSGAAAWVQRLERLGWHEAIVHGDMVTAHRGALAGAPGLVVVAGTGSVALAIAPGGTFVKVGGWGPIYGNEGSAYALGRDALRAAARAWDGRGPRTALTAALIEALQVPRFDRSIDVVYGRGMGQMSIAALAPLVVAAADHGDAVAAEICAAAARDLVETAVAAAERLADGSPISYAGGLLLGSARIRDAFEQGVREAQPTLRIEPPRYGPVAGAVILACRRLAWDETRALSELEVVDVPAPQRRVS